MIYNILKNKKRGFTLLEMIVSLGIFSLVAVVAVGSLVRITGLNRRAQSLQSAMDNVSFALESMTRNMRYGSGFKCTPANTFSGIATNATGCNPGSGNKGILYTSTKTGAGGCPLIHAYWFDKDTSGKWSIKKSEQNSCGDTIGPGTAISVTDEKNVTLTNVEFAVLTGTGVDNKYSLANFKITGYAGIKETDQTKFTVQTAVSQRIAD